VLHRVMSGRFGIALSVGLLWLSGCAPSTVEKAEPQALSSSSAEQEAKVKPGKAVSGNSGSSSSLDAYRQGKRPESGPLKEIFFAFDRYELSEPARTVLRENAVWLKSNPSAKIEIEGHCDERGTTEYNIALGAKRAGAARDYLMSLGVAAGRISTTSFGEELAICKESSEECYQQNRRDRFVVGRGGPSS